MHHSSMIKLEIRSPSSSVRQYPWALMWILQATGKRPAMRYLASISSRALIWTCLATLQAPWTGKCQCFTSMKLSKEARHCTMKLLQSIKRRKTRRESLRSRAYTNYGTHIDKKIVIRVRWSKRHLHYDWQKTYRLQDVFIVLFYSNISPVKHGYVHIVYCVYM